MAHRGDRLVETDRCGDELGKAGVAGKGPDTFSEPNAVLVAPNGTIFVTDTHVSPDPAAPEVADLLETGL